jgi:hypothetical protein
MGDQPVTIAERPSGAGLIARVQNILLRPGPEWDVIDYETATVPGLFVGYACLLAAIPLIASVLQHLLFIHWLMVPLFVIAVLGYVASLLGAFLTGFIIDILAPNFGGQRNLTQAMKLSVYSYTAVWVAGILNILPVLGILVLIAGLYGLYILYLGLPKLMKSPPDRAPAYLLVSVVVVIVVNIVIGVVIASVTTVMTAGALIGGASALSAAGVHGGDLGKLEAASQQLAAAGAAAGGAGAPGGSDAKPIVAVDPVRLKALLPGTVGGLPETETSSTSAAPGGISASNAEAVYSQGDQRIDLKVTDLGTMGALGGLAGVLSVQSDQQSSSGYKHVGKINGRMTTEEWNNTSRTGTFGVLVADRIMVEANGTNVSIDDLKAAVSAVGPDRVEQIVKS